VSFDAVIDSDKDGDGRQDTALYTWDHGVLTRVVGSGDVIPGLGTVRALKTPDTLDLPFPLSGAPINDHGQIAFQATIQDAAGNLRGVLLVATPGSALLAGAAPAGRAVAEAPTAEQLQPVLAAALHRWQSAGADLSGLGAVEVRIADLSYQVAVICYHEREPFWRTIPR
jgi:hypothetical protein